MASPERPDAAAPARPAEPVPLPHGWPTLRTAAEAAGVSEAAARSEALREEVEHRSAPVRVLAELLDMEPSGRERLKLALIERPDDWFRGWQRRMPPDRTYGDAKRLLAVYGRAESAPDRGPQAIGQLIPAPRIEP